MRHVQSAVKRMKDGRGWDAVPVLGTDRIRVIRFTQGASSSSPVVISLCTGVLLDGGNWYIKLIYTKRVIRQRRNLQMRSKDGWSGRGRGRGRV